MLQLVLGLKKGPSRGKTCGGSTGADGQGGHADGRACRWEGGGLRNAHKKRNEGLPAFVACFAGRAGGAGPRPGQTGPQPGSRKFPDSTKGGWGRRAGGPPPIAPNVAATGPVSRFLPEERGMSRGPAPRLFSRQCRLRSLARLECSSATHLTQPPACSAPLPWRPRSPPPSATAREALGTWARFAAE